MKSSPSRLAPIFLLVVVVAAFVFGFAAGRGTGWLGSLFQPRTTDRSGPVLLKSIENLSRFDAAVGNFSEVVDLERRSSVLPVPLPHFIVGRHSWFIAVGTVDAQVEFSRLTQRGLSLSADGNTVTVRLPEPHLGQPNLDQNQSHLISQTRGVVTAFGDLFSSRDQSELHRLGEHKIAAAAEKSGLVQRAERNTRKFLTGFLTALGIPNVNVTFGIRPQ